MVGRIEDGVIFKVFEDVAVKIELLVGSDVELAEQGGKIT